MSKKRKQAPSAFPFPRGTEIELEITTLTNMGQGLGRIAIPEAAAPESSTAGETAPASGSPTPISSAAPAPDADGPGSGGWVVLVPFALPGDRIRARVWRNQRNFSEADLVEIIRPSPDRIDPPCPLFTACGGCQYQNLTYERQLEWKRRQVAELLEHMARVSHPVNPVIASPRSYGYRSKITPHFGKPRDDRPLAIGFLKAGSRRALVDVERCLLATDRINERLRRERERIRREAAQGRYRRGATLLLRDSADGVVTDPSAIIRERVEGLDLRFPAGEFFQNNPFILEKFTAHVRERAAADGARYLVDTYCGSGLFCLTGARAFTAAAGIEISEASIRWAQENARRNGIANCTFIAGDAAEIFAQVTYPPADTAVVIDPPRRGSDPQFLGQLTAFGPRTVVYVSCNPATQMRDLPHLLTAGYTITDIQPFDLFPQTKHLECVISLRRADG